MTTGQFFPGHPDRTEEDSMDSIESSPCRNAMNDNIPTGRNPVVTEACKIWGILLEVRLSGNEAFLDLDDHGVLYTGVECHADTGRKLAGHIGDSFVFSGEGTWERVGDGDWQLRSFIVSQFTLLPEKSLIEEIDEIRQWIRNNARCGGDPSGPAPQDQGDFSRF